MEGRSLNDNSSLELRRLVYINLVSLHKEAVAILYLYTVNSETNLRWDEDKPTMPDQLYCPTENPYSLVAVPIQITIS